MSKILHNPKSHAPAVYIPCWLIQVPHDELSHGAKILYGRLAQWSNTKGSVYRSSSQLAKEIGIGTRSIERLIKELKDCKLIDTRHPQAGGVNHFVFYDHEWMHSDLTRELNYQDDNFPPLRSEGTPPTDLSVPPDKSVGTPPTDLSDINIKEIKEIKIKHKTKTNGVKNKNVGLSLEEISLNNPHEIPKDLLLEWKSSRKKPVTERVLNAFNKELSAIKDAGIKPVDAVNKMLDKQWSTVELRFFENDIAYKNGKKPSATKYKSMDDIMRSVL